MRRVLDTPLTKSYTGLQQRKQGNEHNDGHINFFSPKTYRELLKKSGFEIISEQSVISIVPSGSEEILLPEELCFHGRDYYKNNMPSLKRIGQILIQKKLIPHYFIRKILGSGEHLC